MIIGPWEEYKPAGTVQESLPIVFIKSNEMDWYKYRDQLPAGILVVFTEDGSIINTYTDYSRAFPNGLYTGMAETIPDDFTRENYRFGEAGFYPYTPTEDEIRAKSRRIIDFGCNKVTEEMNRLTMLGNIESLSEAEKERVSVLKAFIKALRSVDLLNPIWPDLP